MAKRIRYYYNSFNDCWGAQFRAKFWLNFVNGFSLPSAAHRRRQEQALDYLSAHKVRAHDLVNIMRIDV